MSFRDRRILQEVITGEAGSTPLPLDVVSYGGVEGASVLVAAGGSEVILAAPEAGTAYRCHMLTVDSLAASQGLNAYGTSSGIIFANMVATSPSLYLGGQLIEGQSITVACDAGNEVAVYLTYDTVSVPQIN